MIPVDDVAAERVYHQVAEAIRLRRVQSPVRDDLRLVWLGDGGEGAKIGSQIAANKCWSNKADCSHSWKCWWDGAKGYIPSCRTPGAPIPVLVNNLNVLVAILSEEALPS